MILKKYGKTNIIFPGLHAFEHEGIQNITALKDQLISANHNQSEAILKRHADVIDRYCISISYFIFYNKV